MVKEKMNQSNNEKTCGIIIITHNNLDYTKKCIKSIEANTKGVNYRYIFVDNDSTDGTVDYLKKIKNSVLISNTENMGFAKAMNQGLEKVTSKYTVWLNNDTIVTPQWLHYLINHLEKIPNAGAIGPISNATGIIQRDNTWEGKPNVEEVSIFGQKWHKENYGKVIEFHRIAGFCIVMKSELIEKVGFLDEQFNFGGYDDDDYCLRIRNAGYKILIAEDVFIHHKSGATFTSIRNPDYDLGFLMQKLRREFLKKWVPNEIQIKKTVDEKENGKNPLVSIILPTKNRPKIIQNAINSIIKQSYKNWELVVVNDGGNDISDIIERIGDKRIKYFNCEQSMGKSHANNLGIKKASAEIIAYLDDDDRWLPNHLEASVKGLLKHKSRQFTYSDYIKIDCLIDENDIQIPTRKELILQMEARDNSLKETNFIPNFSVVHYRSLFDLVGYYDEELKYYEDWDIFRRFSQIVRFTHVPEVTGEYWISQQGITRNISALLDKNLLKIKEYIKNKKIDGHSEPLDLLSKGDKLRENSKFESAKNMYEKILKIDPDFFPAVEGIADCFYNLKELGVAKKYYLKFLKLNLNLLLPYTRIAECLMNENKYNEAKKLLEFGLIIADDRLCYDLLQNCYKKLGKKESANFIKRKTIHVAENLDHREVEETLLKLYSKSSFWRFIFTLGYKFIKKIT